MDKVIADMVFLRTPFNYDMAVASDASALGFPEGEGPYGRTKQSFKEEVDINTLVKRFGLGYEMPPAVNAPTSAWFDKPMDFSEAMQVVVDAQNSFMALSADDRARFLNDPARFVAFCLDEKNLDELVKMGFANAKPKPVEAVPLKVEVVNPAPPAAKP